jgi:peptidyl-prolyl cis-trans isomerase C
LFKKLTLTVAAVLIALMAAVTMVAAQDQAEGQEEKAAAESAEPKAQAQEEKQEPQNVAIVNGVAISKNAFDTEISRMLQQLMQGGQGIQPQQFEQLREIALDNLIKQQLLFEAAKEAGYSADEATVEDRLAKLKERFGDEEKYRDALEKMGADEESLKQEIRQSLKVNQFVTEKFVDTVEITDEQVQEFYDENPRFFQQPGQVKASHVLIKIPEEADEAQKAEALQKAEDVKKKAEAGEDFAELAKEYSEGPSAEQGGDLGFFQKEQMVGPFAEAAFAMEPGQISDVVETQFGYHVIKVADKKEARTMTLDEVHDQLVQYLKQQTVEKRMDEYLESAKADAEVEVLLEPVEKPTAKPAEKEKSE